MREFIALNPHATSQARGCGNTQYGFGTGNYVSKVTLAEYPPELLRISALKPKAILSIGSGWGFFELDLMRYGVDAYGTDPEYGHGLPDVLLQTTDTQRFFNRSLLEDAPQAYEDSFYRNCFDIVFADNTYFSYQRYENASADLESETRRALRNIRWLLAAGAELRISSLLWADLEVLSAWAAEEGFVRESYGALSQAQEKLILHLAAQEDGIDHELPGVELDYAMALQQRYLYQYLIPNKLPLPSQLYWVQFTRTEQGSKPCVIVR